MRDRVQRGDAARSSERVSFCCRAGRMLGRNMEEADRQQRASGSRDEHWRGHGGSRRCGFSLPISVASELVRKWGLAPAIPCRTGDLSDRTRCLSPFSHPRRWCAAASKHWHVRSWYSRKVIRQRRRGDFEVSASVLGEFWRSGAASGMAPWWLWTLRYKVIARRGMDSLGEGENLRPRFLYYAGRSARYRR